MSGVDEILDHEPEVPDGDNTEAGGGTPIGHDVELEDAPELTDEDPEPVDAADDDS